VRFPGEFAESPDSVGDPVPAGILAPVGILARVRVLGAADIAVAAAESLHPEQKAESIPTCGRTRWNHWTKPSFGSDRERSRVRAEVADQVMDMVERAAGFGIVVAAVEDTPEPGSR